MDRIVRGFDVGACTDDAPGKRADQDAQGRRSKREIRRCSLAA